MSLFRKFLILVNILQEINFIWIISDLVSIVDKHGVSWSEKRGCGHAIAGFDHHAQKKKGSDPCVKGSVCPSCNILTEDQKLRLATPVYQKKKEKRELKAQTEETTPVDPSRVSVLGVAAEGGDKSSEETCSTPVAAKTKKNAESLEEASSATVKTKKIKSLEVAKHKGKKRQSPPAKSSKGSTDSKLEGMDLKWSEI